MAAQHHKLGLRVQTCVSGAEGGDAGPGSGVCGGVASRALEAVASSETDAETANTVPAAPVPVSARDTADAAAACSRLLLCELAAAEPADEGDDGGKAAAAGAGGDCGCGGVGEGCLGTFTAGRRTRGGSSRGCCAHTGLGTRGEAGDSANRPMPAAHALRAVLTDMPRLPGGSRQLSSAPDCSRVATGALTKPAGPARTWHDERWVLLLLLMAPAACFNSATGKPCSMRRASWHCSVSACALDHVVKFEQLKKEKMQALH